MPVQGGSASAATTMGVAMEASERAIAVPGAVCVARSCARTVKYASLEMYAASLREERDDVADGFLGGFGGVHVAFAGAPRLRALPHGSGSAMARQVSMVL